MKRKYRRHDGTGLVCAAHCVAFVRFVGIASNFSHGCPVCVGMIRAKVQFEIARNKHWKFSNAAVQGVVTKRSKVAQAPRI